MRQSMLMSLKEIRKINLKSTLNWQKHWVCPSKKNQNMAQRKHICHWAAKTGSSIVVPSSGDTKGQRLSWLRRWLGLFCLCFSIRI